MRPITVFAIAVCLAATLQAADRAHLSGPFGARSDTRNFTLLPGPLFLSPAGSSSPGHHWTTVKPADIHPTIQTPPVAPIPHSLKSGKEPRSTPVDARAANLKFNQEIPPLDPKLSRGK